MRTKNWPIAHVLVRIYEVIERHITGARWAIRVAIVEIAILTFVVVGAGCMQRLPTYWSDWLGARTAGYLWKLSWCAGRRHQGWNAYAQ